VRIGVVGAGSVSQQMHLPYLAELGDRFQVAGVCDASAMLAAQAARGAGAELATTDPAELFAARLDAVLIAVNGPADGLALDALRAGAHVLVEKPLAWSVERAAAVEAAAAHAGRVAMVGYMKRYDPAFALARAAVERMGPVRGGAARCVAGPNEAYIRDVAQVRTAGDVPARVAADLSALSAERLREAIGDAPPDLALAFRLIVGIACHELGVLRGLLGAPVAVSAARVWDEGRWLSATLRYEDFALDYLLGRMTTRIFDERFELYSEREALELSFPSPFLKHAPTLLTRRYDDPDRSVAETSIGSYQEAFRRELEHFHDCVTTGAPPDTPAWEARADAEIMVAIVRAARDGAPQPLVHQRP
jgi:predicted dehydrogenase